MNNGNVMTEKQHLQRGKEATHKLHGQCLQKNKNHLKMLINWESEKRRNKY